jgi:lysine-N-methylase
MPLPVRTLPVLPNWDCHGCSDCCRTYHVRVTPPEKERIAAQGWEAKHPDFAQNPPVVWDDKQKMHRLAHKADGPCVFLGPDNRCRIHAEFGSAGKPLACRLYPFVLLPAGDHWRVGLRYACPSAAAPGGRPASEHRKDLGEYAKLLEAERGKAGDLPPPPLGAGQNVPWPDLLRFAETLSAMMVPADQSVEYKLRGIMNFAAVCRRARFEKVQGARLAEFLELVAVASAEETVPRERVPAPGWVGRTVFRQAVALYARKDRGLNAGGMAARGSLGRAAAAWRFARGRGAVPPVHGLLPAVHFADAEVPAGPLPDESERLLTQYFRVKFESLQFCGAGNFGLNFWDGLDALLLTFPAVLWLSRLLATARPRPDAIRLALQIVDDNFGFNPLLGSARQAWGLRMLRVKDELPKLIAHYGS